MENLIDIEALGIAEKILDEKKEQTTYKTQYVKQYVNNWLCVMSNEKKFETINFIDCMCNAGIYKDGDPCTSILVLDLFINNANRNKEKTYNIFLNDISIDRITSTKKIIDYKYPMINQISNLHLHYDNKDVNVYLKEQSYKNVFKYPSATVLYVDPYDFGTVKISNVANFLNYNYCEILFNVFTMDFVRNGNDERIQKCIDCSGVYDKADLMNKVVQMLKVSKIKYCFSYQFKNKNDTELYQIFYATPNIRGLEKLKEAIWKVFKGKRFHRNKRVYEQEQLCMFSEEDDEEYFLRVYSEEAKELLINTFKNIYVSYKQIETLILEKTMLRETHIRKNVLIPLIDEGIIIKKGLVSKINFKEDYYEIKGD